MGLKPPTTLRDTYVYSWQKCCLPTRHLDGQPRRQEFKKQRTKKYTTLNPEPVHWPHAATPRAATISSVYDSTMKKKESVHACRKYKGDDIIPHARKSRTSTNYRS